jgi:hypothetical protein
MSMHIRAEPCARCAIAAVGAGRIASATASQPWITGALRGSADASWLIRKPDAAVARVRREAGDYS